MSRKAKPLHDRLLVLRNEAESITVHGIVIPDGAKEKPLEGVVQAVGPKCTQVHVHDAVLFSKYAGTEVSVDDQEFLLLSEEDILAVFE